MNVRETTRELLCRLYEPALTPRQVANLLAQAVEAKIRVRPWYVTSMLKCLETLALTACGIAFGFVLVVFMIATGLVGHT